MDHASSSDPRVRRSRRAIVDAAIALVTERETSAISMTDLAEAADLSRPVLYQHFGDRNRILIAAMTDLIDRELLPAFDPPSDDSIQSARMIAEHFAHYRSFYRALLLGPASFEVMRSIADLFITTGADILRRRSDGTVDDARLDELAKYLSAGATMMFAEWLVDGPETLDPTDAAARLVRMDQTLSHLRPA